MAVSDFGFYAHAVNDAPNYFLNVVYTLVDNASNSITFLNSGISLIYRYYVSDGYGIACNGHKTLESGQYIKSLKTCTVEHLLHS